EGAIGETDVSTLEGREPVTAVLVGVLLAADPEEAAVEQRDREAEDTLTREPVAVEQPLGRRPQTWKAAREPEHLVELLAVALLTPDRVVEILPPAGGVRPHRLQMPVPVAADPDVAPRRRDHECPDPLELRLVVEPLTVLVDVREATPAPEA